MLDPGRLQALRRTLAQIDAKSAGGAAPRRVLSLGIPALDAALGGGLSLGALHEIAPAAPIDIGAAAGFALILAVRAGSGRPVLWIQQDFAALEAGNLYGPGFDLFGLPMGRLVVLRVAHAVDALWAMEEALASGAVATVIAEFAKNGGDLTATRRLSLAATAGGTLGLLLRHRPSSGASAAPTRWEIAAAAGPRDAFGGLGSTSLSLSLVKNRHGPTGRWLASWNHHEHVLAATLSLGVAATARDRSDRPSSLARIA